MIEQCRKEGINEANGRSKSFPAFGRDPLAPFRFEVGALDHTRLEKVGRVEEVRPATQLLQGQSSKLTQTCTYVDERSPHGLCKLVRPFVAAPQACQHDEQVDMDQARAS